jgi:hypothetical protein
MRETQRQRKHIELRKYVCWGRERENRREREKKERQRERDKERGRERERESERERREISAMDTKKFSIIKNNSIKVNDANRKKLFGS